MSDEQQVMLERIKQAWERHSQHIAYQFPAGCGGHIPLKTPAVMSELAFRVAVLELLGVGKDSA